MNSNFPTRRGTEPVKTPSAHCALCITPSRRGLILTGFAAFAAGPALASPALPAEVAGIAIPRARLALASSDFARRACPDFLFNHCMRTYLFGALAMRSLQRAFDADEAFSAAALHDLGLLAAFESIAGSFETDGADTAERMLGKAGASPTASGTVWRAIVAHDGRWSVARHEGPEAMLVAAGAGADVIGPSERTDPAQTAEILAAFPRLHFKARFTDLLAAHCRRKPTSQAGTWLEGLCRQQVPGAFKDSVIDDIAAAPFAE